jgi:hypothetical protein
MTVDCGRTANARYLNGFRLRLAAPTALSLQMVSMSRPSTDLVFSNVGLARSSSAHFATSSDVTKATSVPMSMEVLLPWDCAKPLVTWTLACDR